MISASVVFQQVKGFYGFKTLNFAIDDMISHII
jgi:hypothetical protein